MPATRPRKAKPVAIWRAARFRLVLPIRYQAISTMIPTITTCQKMARNIGSDHDRRSAFLGAARAPLRRGSAVAPDMASNAPLSSCRTLLRRACTGFGATVRQSSEQDQPAMWMIRKEGRLGPSPGDPRSSNRDARSADRRSVLQAALGPDVVDAALHTHRGDVAVPDLAKIADLLDDVVGPFVVDPERLSHVALEPEQAANVRVRAGHEAVDVLAGDALLLGGDHRDECPAHEV